MSHTHHIDNEDPLFQFDSYDQLISPVNHLEVSARPQLSSLNGVDLTGKPSSSNFISKTSQPRPPLSSGKMEDTDVKGKGVPQPVFVAASGVLEDDCAPDAEDDMFAMSLGSASSSVQTPVLDVDEETDEDIGDSLGKGKARELPPSLPPLSLYTELNYESSDWPSFEASSPAAAGPSSYRSISASINTSERGHNVSVVDRVSAPPEFSGQVLGVVRVPSRRRSLSSLSVRSNRSLSTLSMSKVKVRLAGTKGPGNLARKLLFKKRTSPPESPSSADSTSDIDVSGCEEASCFSPWSRDLKGRTTAAPMLDLDLSLSGLDPLLPLYCAGRGSNECNMLRTKGRSYSSPLPLPSTPLDLVPVTTADIFEPIRVVSRNYFDEYLPHELKVQVLAALVHLHEAEYQRNVREGEWTVLKASSSRNKWVGTAKGLRELFRLSRVSKYWQALVYDGQLWTNLDLRYFPKLPASVLAQLCDVAGGFIRHIDVTGHVSLSHTTLLDITNFLCIQTSITGDLTHTHLTSINLQGCSALSTRSLHNLLIRSPSLQKLCVKGLTAVTNTTCDILAVYCPKLVTLDFSRCPNMDGDGVHCLASTRLARKEHLPLKVLRLSGLKRVTDDMMACLGKAAPDLEVLDLSYARDLHNSAVEAFVACTEADAVDGTAVQLTSREAGRDPSDPTSYWRRVTCLRHLALSSCIFLTDHACSHLAHAVPKLEFLEMAGIGADLRDDGLVRLLGTTPFIRRLDLEDATEITDDLLFAITPDLATASAPSSRTPVAPQPGHALEYLVISGANNITNDAMQELICSCSRLRVLEADNTRVSGLTVREFVETMRERKMVNAQVVAIDCRNVGEIAVKDLIPHTRPRIGWRAWEAKKLGYLDARDEEGLNVGQDECDKYRVALKTFYSWQTVDAVRAARDKKRKSKRSVNVSSSGAGESPGPSSRAKWWSPGGRRSGATSPLVMDMNNDREGCVLM
ncbi:predicted protein [Sparassis crispa]|uniref:F-box domain-containing protein n=1 Tax=Sparassis crispa TaxID=139825 RepID=A0A401G5V1_9APHY|nr:predicted protein [Sparassis crispa]GBE77542.1 predicted protein [Sparassis crispa]